MQMTDENIRSGDRGQAVRPRSTRVPGAEPVPVHGLFEAHLTTGDLARSVRFYRDVVGLAPAYEVPDRGAAFFWVGEAGRGMLGLWSLGSAPVALALHVGFEVALEDVLGAVDRLRALGVTPRSFFGDEADEPSVIGWMPAAAVYFRDPTGTCSSTWQCSTGRRVPTAGS